MVPLLHTDLLMKGPNNGEREQMPVYEKRSFLYTFQTRAHAHTFPMEFMSIFVPFFSYSHNHRCGVQPLDMQQCMNYYYYFFNLWQIFSSSFDGYSWEMNPTQKRQKENHGIRLLCLLVL